jgi:2-haloacid dehalogenase
VRGVLLDVFETLFSADKLQTAFEECGIDAARVPYWVGCVMNTGIAITAAQDYRRFSDVAVSALVSLDPSRIGRKEAQAVLAVMKELAPYPDVVAGLTLLRASGVRIMTLSSAERHMCEALLSSGGLRDMVDGCLSGETVRRWKPAPEPYIFGVAQIGWPASQVAFISAREWDIHGAHRAGLQTGHVQRHPPPEPPIYDAADVAGPDLPTVVERLLHGQ